jgi:RNA polymerase sigma factor (sigma-70 family)
MTEDRERGRRSITHRTTVPLETTDAAIIRRSLREPDLFAVIFERHFAAVHRYAQQRVGEDVADEITSETFVVAFDRRRRFDPESAGAGPWLLGIATNLMRRHWRAERQQLRAIGSTPPAGGVAEELRGPHVRPMADVSLQQDVADALAEINQADRETLLLFAWADLSYAEVATALDVPIGTVRSRIARARRQLRDRLGQRASAVPRPRPPTPLLEEYFHG